jgi:hypothetical protein
MKVTKTRLILTISVYLGVVIAFTSSILPVLAQNVSAPGGFVESATSTTIRSLLSASQIAGFLPQRGVFTFPAPYNTQGVRLTNGSDCGGTDCVKPVGYSYWRRMNNHVGSDTIYVMMTLDRQKGGGGPNLFSYNKTTGVTSNLGPLFNANDALSWAHGEMWYFSATRPNALYIHDGSRFMRYDVVNKTTELIFDVAAQYGSDKYIWQPNSSDNDQVHSFTLRRDGDYAMLGCGVYNESSGTYRFYNAAADFDECQIDRSGRFLVIKQQVDGAQGEDNTIIDLSTGAQRLLIDPQGAGGHSDMGHGYMVAEDNYNNLPGAVRVWRLDLDPNDSANGKLVFQSTSWDWGANHITHTNARAGAAPEGQIACSSEVTRNSIPRGNEILCFKLDGSMQVLVVAPVMTNLDAAGGGDDYYKAPKGHLDVTGEYLLWTSNMGTNRVDAFIVRVPTQLLGVTSTNPGPTPSPTPEPSPSPSPTPTPAPAPTPTPTPVPAPVAVSWTSLIQAVSSGATVSKNGGCNGCADSGALSTQEIGSGDGYFEFTTANNRPLRFVGLGTRNTGTTGNEIKFALRIQKGVAEVRESGAAKGHVRFAAGDALRIAVANGRVNYSKNGKVFYQSATAVSYPLVVDTALYEAGAEVSNATITATSSGTEPTPTPTPGGSASWINLVNAAFASPTLRKTSGCAGCPDAGATTQQSFASTNGGFDFSVTETNLLRNIGIATPGGNPVTMTLPYAIRVQGGRAEVRESGNYRSEVNIAAGDVLSISIASGQVRYSRNGAVFYTSNLAANGQFAGYAQFYDIDASVSNAIIR